MKIPSPLLCFAAIALSSCSERPAVEASYDVIPLPQKVALDSAEKAFKLNPRTRIVATDSAQQINARLFAEYISSLTGFTPKIVSNTPASEYIHLTTDPA